jgi:hypothetical protein
MCPKVYPALSLPWLMEGCCGKLASVLQSLSNMVTALANVLQSFSNVVTASANGRLLRVGSCGKDVGSYRSQHCLQARLAGETPFLTLRDHNFASRRARANLTADLDSSWKCRYYQNVYTSFLWVSTIEIVVSLLQSLWVSTFLLLSTLWRSDKWLNVLILL